VLLVYQPAALKRMHTQLMSWQSWLEGTIGGPGRWCLVFYSRLAAGRIDELYMSISFIPWLHP